MHSISLRESIVNIEYVGYIKEMKKLFVLIIFILFSNYLYAHPHMQIMARTNFEFKNDAIMGVWSEWEFDEYFSADIIMSFDVDEDGNFDDVETLEVYNNAFISLKDFNYFTFIRVGEERTTPDRAENFSLYIADNGKIVYKFYVPLTNIKSRDFYLSIYDFTYFCACFYQDIEPVKFIGTESVTPEYTIAKNEKYPIYFDPYAGPDDTTVHTKWKKGLNELVIKEIHIVY